MFGRILLILSQRLLRLLHCFFRFFFLSVLVWLCSIVTYADSQTFFLQCLICCYFYTVNFSFQIHFSASFGSFFHTFNFFSHCVHVFLSTHKQSCDGYLTSLSASSIICQLSLTLLTDFSPGYEPDFLAS